jgi:MFS family permease
MLKKDLKIILGASLGTAFEWYDFYLYGILASIIAKNFFNFIDPSLGFIFALLTFASGFIVRPLGAIIFGRFGDLYGRKKTFLITISLMGLATILVGLLPNYNSIGFIAPTILVTLRMLQGFAVGGEYGGAAIYVAENVPHNRRGY